MHRLHRRGVRLESEPGGKSPQRGDHEIHSPINRARPVGGGSASLAFAVMDTGLAGKGVVVTGASGGIGAACARLFAAEGANVLVHYHRGEERAPPSRLRSAARRPPGRT